MPIKIVEDVRVLTFLKHSFTYITHVYLDATAQYHTISNMLLQ